MNKKHSDIIKAIAGGNINQLNKIVEEANKGTATTAELLSAYHYILEHGTPKAVRKEIYAYVDPQVTPENLQRFAECMKIYEATEHLEKHPDGWIYRLRQIDDMIYAVMECLETHKYLRSTQNSPYAQK